jgi:hypothetical protein
LNSLVRVPSWIASYWRASAIIGGIVGFVTSCRWSLDRKENRGQFIHSRQEKELQSLLKRISKYACEVHKRYPTGEVIVSEADLAMLMRKPPGMISTALNVLLNDKRAQKAPLSGYWKLLV